MKIALVVGCAENVWEEVEAAKRLIPVDGPSNVYCVKMVGIEWPEKFKSWVTLHPEFMAVYQKQRRDKGLPDPMEIVAPLTHEVGSHAHHPADRRVTYRWPKMTMSGSSGLFAVKVALEDGFEKVLLAGVPMLPERNHFKRGAPWLHCESFRHGWNFALPYIRDKVRSPSGWTRELLGEPTEEWLRS